MKDELLSDDLRFENNKTIERHSTPANDFNTLNESVWATLQRDLIRIKNKLFVVVVPFTSKEKEKELRHWDLWGPFLFCLLFGIMLMIDGKSASTVLVTIFTIIWVGSCIITINTTLLGGEITYLQCMCLIGYCLFPITLGAILNKLILMKAVAIVKIIIAAIAFVWSIKASAAFLTASIPENKRNLAIYPILLFYLFLTWFIR